MKPWRTAWTNFRGFRRRTQVELRRFTVLIGRNNVGKTSVYAPLLLLRQTLEAKDPRTALLTRGALIDVGSYRDLISSHEIERQLTLAVGLDSMVRFQSTPQADGMKETRLGRLEVTFAAGDDGHTVLLHRSRLLDHRNSPLISRVRDGESTYQVTSRMMPSRQSVGRPLKEVTALRRGMREEEPQGFLFDGMGALRIPVEMRRDQERWSKMRTWFNAAYSMVDVYAMANWEIQDRLQSIAYLGPLRSLPLRTYRFSAERPNDVGREGQFAPEVLLRRASDEARHIVDEWLTKLGYGSLEFERLSEDFFQVFVRMAKSNSLRVNFAHCGIGLSQLLPVLVQGAIAPETATFIAQQPEIHLNPAQQCLITDFLIDTSLRDRRVVVETHSEHVLLRLRRRIAEGHIASSDIAVYYCDFRDGESVIDAIELGPKGELSRDDWPDGFFEEQLSDSFALARAQARG